MIFILKLKDLALDILFPPICVNCGNSLIKEEKGRAVCNACLSKITIHTTLFCGICRARLPENKKICHKNSQYLLGAATNFDETIRNLIHQFKYQKWQRVLNPLKIILEIYLNNLQFNSESLKNYIVIPIPLHKNRLQERGFNQAELIGKIIAEKYNLPLETKILFRNKETKSQAELKNWGERKNNLASAFKIENADYLKNKNIILVDDVCTSGATIQEAAKILKENSAKKIIALVIAKTR